MKLKFPLIYKMRIKVAVFKKQKNGNVLSRKFRNFCFFVEDLALCNAEVL